MTKTARQLNREIATALSRHSQPSTTKRTLAPKKDTRMSDLDEALRHYAWLAEAATRQSPGRTADAWDDVATRIETGIQAAGLEGDYRTFALDRAKDARTNARWLRLRAQQPAPNATTTRGVGLKMAHATMKPVGRKVVVARQKTGHLKLPKADKYEFWPYGRGDMVTTLDPTEAITLLETRDGTLVAVKNGAGRTIAASVKGRLLSGRAYQDYLEGRLCL